MIILAISKKKKKKKIECHSQNWVSFPPPQLSSFSIVVLTALENGWAQEIRCQTIENRPNESIIQNLLYRDDYIPHAVVSIIQMKQTCPTHHLGIKTAKGKNNPSPSAVILSLTFFSCSKKRKVYLCSLIAAPTLRELNSGVYFSLPFNSFSLLTESKTIQLSIMQFCLVCLFYGSGMTSCQCSLQ